MDQGKHGDVYDQSFVLSPGRKSLSESNLLADANDDLNATRTSSVMSSYSRSIAGSNSNISSSVLNLSRLKAFRSLKNLDQVQISLKSKRRPRNASEGELSIQSRLRDRLHPEDPGTLRIV